jgi:zinc and cadmium transporter
VLVVELVLVAAAAWIGGASVALLHLGHRRMQVLLSFTGGILLGVAFLHLLPHATRALGGRVDDAAPWLLGGFFLMFLLERAFHGHAHHAADPEHGPSGGCDHEHHPHPPHAEAPRGGAWGHGRWSGAFAGLAVHSLADGAALAAAADLADGPGGIFAGLATFLAILLHKPIDAGLIAALMLKSGASPAVRSAVNLAHALLVPLGALLFVVCLGDAGPERVTLLGGALAMAAGAFVCIAAADLLPEVEFHSHDRLLLSASLALGITLAAGITTLERELAPRGRAAAAPPAPAAEASPPPRDDGSR